MVRGGIDGADTAATNNLGIEPAGEILLVESDLCPLSHLPELNLSLSQSLSLSLRASGNASVSLNLKA